MSKLKNIIAGDRAIKRVSVPLQNCNDESGKPREVMIGLRCLTGEEYGEALAGAAKLADAFGVSRLDEDDSRWALALHVYVIAIACIDPDSDPLRPEPFFAPDGDDSSPAARARYIMASPLIGRDTIEYLYEQQELWQDECNPRKRQVSPAEIEQVVKEAIATESYAPFLRLAPAARLNCLLFMGVQWLGSLVVNSSPGPSSSEQASDSQAPNKSES